MRQSAETKSRIGLICANSPIDLSDPTGLDPDFDSQEEQLSRMEEMLAGSGCMDANPVYYPFVLFAANNGGSGDGGLGAFGSTLLTNAGTALGDAAISGGTKEKGTGIFSYEDRRIACIFPHRNAPQRKTSSSISLLFSWPPSLLQV